MQLTDQELFYILQVKAPAKPMPWENSAASPLGSEWAEWAKGEVLSGKGVRSGSCINFERCAIYLARLLRVLETVAENGGLETRRREDGAFVFEKSTLKTILSDGLEACGCQYFHHEDALLLATHDGLLSEHEYDDWHPGMASGSGVRTYYGLTFKGKRRAEKASLTAPVCDEADEAKDEGAPSSPGPDGPEAQRDTPDTPVTPPAMEGNEILELCRSRPNEAFLSWKALEEEVARCAPFEEENQGKNRATLGVFRGWFEECGHWRDLKPGAEDFDPNERAAHATHGRQIEEFMLTRQARLQFVDYDEVHVEHTCRAEGTESANTEYRWTYLLAGEPQLILTYDDYQAEFNGLRTHYLRKARPCGFAYSEAEDIGRTCVECCAYFRSGMYLEFICDFGGDIYPPNRRKPGDYELRDVGNKTTLEEQIKTNTDRIPEVLQKVNNMPLRTAAFLKGPSKFKLGTLGPVVEEEFTASAHFTHLTWRGNTYVLKKGAAVIVESLYIAQKTYALPGLHQDEVFAQVYGANKKDWPSGNTRIQNFFRTGDAKRLWDDGCVQHDGKGNFRLSIKIHT